MTGINHSILFMLAMVFFVVSGFSFLVWNSYRTARKRLAQGDPDQPAG